MKQEVRLPLLHDWFLLKAHPVLPWMVYWALARLLLCGSAGLIHTYSSQLVGAPTQVPPAAGEIRLYGSPDWREPPHPLPAVTQQSTLGRVGQPTSGEGEGKGEGS